MDSASPHPDARISCVTASAFCPLRAAITTRKPFLASSRAVAFPTPSVAPVIKQTGWFMASFRSRQRPEELQRREFSCALDPGERVDDAVALRGRDFDRALDLLPL